jgi:hypothetical protein
MVKNGLTLALITKLIKTLQVTASAMSSGGFGTTHYQIRNND